MEENKKTIWIVLGLGVVGLYLFMKNKATAAVKTSPKPGTPGTGTTPGTTTKPAPVFVDDNKVTAPEVTTPYNWFENVVIPDQKVLPKPTADGTTNLYPVGVILTPNQLGNVNTGVRVQLKEGDAIKGIPETVYILKGGEKHPVTEKWWFFNYGEDWTNVITLSNTTVDMIPTGSTFTINGQ
jgi:hypothetical protein